ncbi:MAG: uracil-DNA glycosylase [Bacilli bacterium]|nr:uracil-DNA glycosylase [Bacilli bacterium]
MKLFNNDWDEVLESITSSKEFYNTMVLAKKEYATKTVFPPKELIFEALKLTSYEDTKVVIVGQDPYHGTGEAHGLSFSVRPGVRVPPSLQNIYKEIESDLGIKEPANCGDLTKWAKEGVLLLNSILTVEKDKAGSHSALGWEMFTDSIIKKLNEKETPIVFILWGSFARSKKFYITNPIHHVVESTHPSPFSARNGFFGSKPFSKTNEFLQSDGLKPIDWQL